MILEHFNVTYEKSTKIVNDYPPRATLRTWPNAEGFPNTGANQAEEIMNII
jgi:hypothetical protein